MKRFAIFSGVVLAAAAGLLSGGGMWAARALEREFNRASGGVASLSVGHVGVDIFRGWVVLENVKIAAAKGRENRVPKKNRASVKRSAGVREIILEGLKLSNDTLSISKLRVAGARITKSEKMRVEVGRIVFEGRDTIVGAAFEDGVLSIAHAAFLNLDKSVRTTIDTMEIEIGNRTASLTHAAMEPTYSKAEFPVKSWRHGDWTGISVENIDCTGLDFANGQLIIDSVHISRGGVLSHKDKNSPQMPRHKPMYHTVFQRFSSRLTLRSAAFEHIDVRYEELPAGSDTAGVLTVEGLCGAAALKTPSDSTGGAYYEWSLTAMMQAAAPISIHGRIPMRGDDFQVAGSLGGCHAAIFNPIATPLTNIEIRSGRIHSLDFTITGDTLRAHSEVVLLYDSLRVELFSRRHRSRRLLSEVVNGMLPPASTSDRPTLGNHTRDPLRSPWNYLWAALRTSLLNGYLKSTTS